MTLSHWPNKNNFSPSVSELNIGTRYSFNPWYGTILEEEMGRV